MKKDKPKKTLLKPQHEVFCRLYTLTEEFFGNATLCYAEAYNYHLERLSKKAVYAGKDVVEENIKAGDIVEDSEYKKAYNTCSVNGKGLLRKTKVQQRCTELLNEWLGEANVDAELAKVVKQDNELAPKVMAIREFNKVKGRVTDKVTLTGFSLSDVLDEVDKDKKK